MNEHTVSPQIAVVVPAFNEARIIGRMLASIPSFVSLIVVVDDKSHDETAEVVRASSDPRVVLVQHTENRGVGAAITTGYREAFSRGAEVCAVMAGDGQMDPADLPRLLAPVLAGEAAYAKGCRISHPEAQALMPRARWIGNVVLAFLTRLVTGYRVRDSQCGYTALSRHAAGLLPLEQLWPRYGYPNDLLGMLREHGLLMREVTVRPVYADEHSGIGLRHAFFVVPYVLARVLSRRLTSRLALVRAPQTSIEP